MRLSCTLTLLTLCIFLFFNTRTSFGQEATDSFLKYHLSQDVYAIDSDASAVVLFERYTVNIAPEIRETERTLSSFYKQTYKTHRIIKILKPEAFSCGNLVVNNVSNVQAVTYNLEDGRINKTSLPKSDIYTKDMGNNWRQTNFSLPAIKEGSIIEYWYETTSSVRQLLPSWNIQGEYPKLKSIYEIHYPNRFQFTSLTQTRIPFDEYKNVDEAEVARSISYHISLDSYGDHTSIWQRENVQAVKEEPYISSINNYRERVTLQMTAMGSTLGTVQNLVNNWERLDKSYWENEALGGQLAKNNDFLDDTVHSLTQYCTSDIEKAKVIFKYVRSKFTITDVRSIYTQKILSNVFSNKAGTSVEINLLLAAMLRKAGLHASMLLLSTVGNIQAKEIFPILDRFNYVVCAVTIDSNKILLDASSKYNAFNTLPQYCYNGYARLIDKKGEGLMLTPDNIREKWVTSVQLSDITDSGMKISVTEKFGNIQSAELRKKWADNDKGFKNYIDEQKEGYKGDVTILNSNILFLDNPDTNLIIKYACYIKNEKHHSGYYLNANYIKFFKANPFKSMTRQLPIEMPYKMDYTYAMTLQVPQGFTMDEIPEPIAVNYDDDKMDYKQLTDYNPDLHWLSINTHFSSNKIVYQVNEYETIRKFFDKIIQEENEIITLKKVENK